MSDSLFIIVFSYFEDLQLFQQKFFHVVPTLLGHIDDFEYCPFV